MLPVVMTTKQLRRRTLFGPSCPAQGALTALGEEKVVAMMMATLVHDREIKQATEEETHSLSSMLAMAASGEQLIGGLTELISGTEGEWEAALSLAHDLRHRE